MGRADKAKRKSGVGAFFGGTFFGFLLGIGAVVGLVAFAYFNVSPKWINDTFDANISLGNEELDSKTLEDVVQTVISISENSNTYTLNSLKDDFGVELPDEIVGINVEDLKSIPLTGLGEAVQNKLSNISAEELKNLFSSETLDSIMGKTVKYYYNVADGKLYRTLTSGVYSNIASFEYKITGDTVKIKTFEPITINSDKSVDITLKYLPLTVALDDFAGNLGNNMTLRELKESFGVELPSYIYNGNEDAKINEIEGLIAEIYIADLLGYKIQDGKVMNGFTEITGIIGIIAKKTVGELGDIQSVIEEQTIATLLDYKIEGGVVKDKGGNTVTGLLGKIARYTIKNINTAINDLTLSDIFTSSQLNSGVFKLLSNPGEIKIIDVATRIEQEIKSSSINELIDAGIISLDSADSAKLTIEVDHDNNAGTAKKAIGDLNINELISYLFDLIPNAG